MSRLCVLATCVLAAWCAQAGVREAGEGVLTDDFEDGTLGGWEVAAEHAEIDAEKGNTVLELGSRQLANQTVWLKGRTFGDFAFEARVRRQYNGHKPDFGLVVRDTCRVGFAGPGRLEFRYRDAQGKAKSVRGLKRSRDLEKYTRLKVVCAGPVARAYVDGEFACQVTDLAAGPGKAGLFASRRRCYFDDVKLTARVEPEQFLAIEPRVADDCLVFPPGKAVTIRFQASNHSDTPKQARPGFSIHSWTGEVVKKPVRKEVSLDGKGQKTFEVDLGVVPAGYHKLVVEPTGEVLPLAIQKRGSGKHEPPAVPIAAYWYFKHWTLPPVWAKTYAHAAAHDLRQHHFNCIVTFIGTPADQLDILAQYGIFAITRGINLDHPGVIGSLVFDEPRPDDLAKLTAEYSKRREKTDKVITTCMVGDGGASPWLREAWDALAPIGKVRAFRWYGIKKSYYGVQRRLAYKHMPRFTEVLRQVRDAHETPYWAILPSFGSNGPDAYFDTPTPSQVKAMMHLSMAYGARGVIFWTYQNPFQDAVAFVEPASLVPTDGKWAAAGDAAGKIARCAKLLASLKPGGHEIWCDDYATEVLPLTDGNDTYNYVVNTDTRRAADLRLFHLNPAATLTDLYAGGPLAIRKVTVELLDGTKMDTGAARLRLEPGEGRLLKYSLKAAAVAPRVKFPDWVEKVPAQKTRYLIGLKAANTPRPGWIPSRDKNIDTNPWSGLNRDAELFAGRNDVGRLYPRSLYAHAETEIVYELPEGFTHFVAAAGFGNREEASSVVFRVLVDGKETFRSDVYRLGPILPVVVDIQGAKKLELVTEDAGDGLRGDYAWWGEARLVVKGADGR